MGRTVSANARPAIDLRFGYRAEDVVATLERVCLQAGYPSTTRADQGMEFVSWGLRVRDTPLLD